MYSEDSCPFLEDENDTNQPIFCLQRQEISGISRTRDDSSANDSYFFVFSENMV